MFDSGHMTLCTHGQMFLHKNTRSSLWIISSRNFRFWHMTLNFWAQEEHYLFVCLLLCVALPVFYILAHLCVCIVNESKLYLFAVRETDALLSAQNSLIRKLKEECQTLGAKLEEMAQSSRYKALSDHVYPINFFIHYKLKPNKKKENGTQSSSCQVLDLHLHLWSRFLWLWKTWKWQICKV